MNLNYFDQGKLGKSQTLMALIRAKVHNLSHHEIYNHLDSSVRVKCFMSYHIFAVWDFIKLLKALHNKTNIALQNQNIVCWKETNNVIEEIVFAEESELYSYSQPTERFALYLCALAELEVDYSCLWSFFDINNNLPILNPGIKELVKCNLTLTETGTIGEILAAFFCGREQLTYQVFTSIIKSLKQEGKEFPILASYTEKLYQENSYPSEALAFKLLDYFCKDETDKIISLQAGLKALNLREQLWNYALAEMIET